MNRVLLLTTLPRRAFRKYANLAGILGLVAIGVLSILIAYWKVGGPT